MDQGRIHLIFKFKREYFKDKGPRRLHKLQKSACLFGTTYVSWFKSHQVKIKSGSRELEQANELCRSHLIKGGPPPTGPRGHATLYGRVVSKI